MRERERVKKWCDREDGGEYLIPTPNINVDYAGICH